MTAGASFISVESVERAAFRAARGCSRNEVRVGQAVRQIEETLPRGDLLQFLDLINE
ncbi:MAG TPA: hypothetical protein VIQ62_09160 [Burkholderiales bacterium]